MPVSVAVGVEKDKQPSSLSSSVKGFPVKALPTKVPSTKTSPSTKAANAPSKSILAKLLIFSFSFLSHFYLSYVPSPIQSILATFLKKHRYVFICLVLIPVSCGYDLFLFVRRWYLNSSSAAQGTTTHQDRILAVQNQIKAAPPGIKMCTARPSFLAMSIRSGLYKNSMLNIDVSPLSHIVSLDQDRAVVFVEPNVNMGDLTRELISRGWTLAVVPELDDLTVGGLIMGFGIETSSHKYGLFQHICTAFEIVLPNGNLVRATKDENPDLFAAIPWSHGTLGFLVGAELKIVKALPYVHMTYLPCHSLDSVVTTFTLASRNPTFDFVELLTYSKNQGVVMVGKMADKEGVRVLKQRGLIPEKGSAVNAIGNYYKPWFYKHVEEYLVQQQGVAGKKLGGDKEIAQRIKQLEHLVSIYSNTTVFATGAPSTATAGAASVVSTLKQEMIPLRDYYHRHTRSIFWELQDIIPFANEWWFRYTLGWSTPPHISLLKLSTPEYINDMYEKAHVVQDMLVPITTLKSSLELFHQELDTYPLWICPMRLLSPPSAHLKTPAPQNLDSIPALKNLPKDSVLAKEWKWEVATESGDGFVGPTKGEALYVDIGAYGVPHAPQWANSVRKMYGNDRIPKHIQETPSAKEGKQGQEEKEVHVTVMKRVEKFVRDNHGYQALYADCYQSRQEFEEMFNHALYDKLRVELGCVGVLPSVYEKVCRKARK